MKITCLFNYASHYRKEIFLEIEDALKCNFYFGDIDKDRIRKIDYSIFKNKIVELKTKTLWQNVVYYRETFSFFFKDYDKILLTGEYYNLTSWFILLINKFTSRESYLWSHGWYGNESYVKKVIKKAYFNLSDGVFLYGNYAKKLMLKEGFKESKLHVIYNSLDYSKQYELRKKLKETTVFKEYFKNQMKVLIFVGRLTEVKKLNMLIEVLKLNTYNLVIVGNGEEKEKLTTLVHEEKLTDRVWFYGESYDEIELSNLIYNADVCVSPGNVGLTAIHSLSYGTPVITHNNFANQMPEFEIIQDGLTGCFFEENDIKSLNDSLMKWFKLENSAAHIKQNCYRRLDEFYNPNFQISTIKKVLF
jgi:glycosyltransferase involved in cell wall biosynthesis